MTLFSNIFKSDPFRAAQAAKAQQASELAANATRLASEHTGLHSTAATLHSQAAKANSFAAGCCKKDGNMADARKFASRSTLHGHLANHHIDQTAQLTTVGKSINDTRYTCADDATSDALVVSDVANAEDTETTHRAAAVAHKKALDANTVASEQAAKAGDQKLKTYFAVKATEHGQERDTHNNRADAIAKDIIVTKGDSTGHPFRGNQYTQAAAAADELMIESNRATNKVNENPTRGNQEAAKNAAFKAAKAHRNALDTLILTRSGYTGMAFAKKEQYHTTNAIELGNRGDDHLDALQRIDAAAPQANGGWSKDEKVKVSGAADRIARALSGGRHGSDSSDRQVDQTAADGSVNISARGYQYFTARAGEEDDDSPSFTGYKQVLDKVDSILKEYGLTNRVKASVEASEKSWIEIHLSPKKGNNGTI